MRIGLDLFQLQLPFQAHLLPGSRSPLSRKATALAIIATAAIGLFLRHPARPVLLRWTGDAPSPLASTVPYW